MSKVHSPAAAIDLGSNSFRCLIGFYVGSKVVVLSRQRALVQLAEGLTTTGKFAAEKLTQSLAALSSFRAEMARLSVTQVRCCATAAFRRSTNSNTLLEPAEKILGCPIEILSGSQEAELSSLGVTTTLVGKIPASCLIADVGGGSTELILHNSAGQPPLVISQPIGTIMLAEQNKLQRTQTLLYFSKQIAKFLESPSADLPTTLVGTGGTATILATLALELPHYDAEKINGYYLSKRRISNLFTTLTRLTASQRRGLPGLEAGREEIIISGLELYQEMIATIGVAGMMVSDAGLLEGILFGLTGDHLN